MNNLEKYNNAFKGQTAFVIASGPSISFLDLTPLSQHITLAVNSGILAYPQSNFFVSDDWSVSSWSYFFNDLRHSKVVPLLYEDKLKKTASMFGDRATLFKHRQGYHVTDDYSHTIYDNHILQARSSVGTAIHIAHIMGCSKIVLLGVDCRRVNDCRYFWQLNPKFKTPYRTDKRVIDDFRRIMHHGNQSDADLVSILKYWNEFGEELNKKCNIVNASNISALEVFPKKDLSEVL